MRFVGHVPIQAGPVTTEFAVVKWLGVFDREAGRGQRLHVEEALYAEFDDTQGGETWEIALVATGERYPAGEWVGRFRLDALVVNVIVRRINEKI